MLSEERTPLRLSWRHSGYSVHTSVTVPRDDRDGLERLARLRPPVSLERLHVGEDAQAIAYAGRRRGGTSRAGLSSAPLDPKEFLARVLMHIPEPRRHVIRSYGAYSNVVRARRARHAAVTVGGEAAPAPPPPQHEPARLEWRAARRRWAELIRRIDEVDPLVCPRCHGPMRIIAFITEPRVIGIILRHLQATGVDARSPPGTDPSSRKRTVTA
ncbi:MAG TPA: transposase [Thermoanaerobaculaceae bacterium]|nr:transposase [Thermoanaerobaculaceae bacterium]